MARATRKKKAARAPAKNAAALPPSSLGPMIAPGEILTVPPRALPPWQIVTREQLAGLMGVHPDTVTDNVRHGMPLLRKGGAGKEGAYDAVACLAWQRSQLGKNAKDNAQTRVFELTAALKQLELKLQIGKLLPRDQVVKEGQVFVKAWSAMVRGLPRRLVQAGVIPPDQEHAAAEVCRDLLTEISQWRTSADAAKAAKVA